ncbi:hypothetical protein K0M31_000582 [Melipona bicolor]|uniref:Uncharacterized protein n=1 Tax=Melipona bicolor TaxID=60889 RepID=A0AA40GDU2_9HYME|nr:hypothetical protein K0M31_000582 [Melipona bicolor]
MPPYLSFVPDRPRTPFAHVNPWEWSDRLGSSREKGQRRGTKRRQKEDDATGEGCRKGQRWSSHFFL